jgi:hypothetical protein
MKKSKRFVFVHEDLWTDQKFLSLSTDARVLFMWSWMPPHAAVCGLYKATAEDVIGALGPARQLGGDDSIEERLMRASLALRELHKAGMVEYDKTNSVIWVVNRVKHAPQTPRAINYMQGEVYECPESPLVDRFLSRWGRLLNIRGREGA